MATEGRKASEYLKIPEISAEDFARHMAEDDFLLRYGNPVVIRRDDKRNLLCMAWEYYERLCRQIGALESGLDALHEDEKIKYWIYEFEMPLKVRQEFEAVCTLHELTPDEFFQAAILRAIKQAKDDPEAERKKILENEKDPELAQVHLVRYYPVYKGETEAQAYKRKLAEEAASKNGGKDPEAKDLSGV